MSLPILHAVLLCVLVVYGQSKFSFVPLAAKTPYLNVWFRNPDGGGSFTQGAQFFTDDKKLGWDGMVRVDGVAYQWMGQAINSTKTVVNAITPTKTVLEIQAGPIQFNATFFSPIEPGDYVRQSTPFSYLYLDGFSVNDALAHAVEVYSDISAEWVARDVKTQVKWDTAEDDTMIYHHVFRNTPQPLTDNNNFAEDSHVYYAAPKRPGFTYRTGSTVNSRKQFAQNGTLRNQLDIDFREIDQRDWPSFSHALDLGNLTSGSRPDPVVWAIGLVRDPLLVYQSSSQEYTGFYSSIHTNISSAISSFLLDFNDALSRSLTFDDRVMSAAGKKSPVYADILSLATRQIFASMDITLSRTKKDGQLNASDIKIFMKDVGVSTRTSPVDVIYGALPALLYFNATLVRDLLTPLFEVQTSSSYAAPDLGSNYPTYFANTSDTHELAVDNCGSMLIMAYTHALKSGDKSLITRYGTVLQRWADFLVDHSLDPPSGSVTMDGSPAGGSSNLALKGILGVYSMAQINNVLGSSDASYMEHATRLAQNWTQLAVTDTHVVSRFGQPDSWGMIYNLFYARWLKTDLISDETLSKQAQFYAGQTAFALDSSQPATIYPHWTLLTAAAIPDDMPFIRTQLIQQIQQRILASSQEFPLPMTYATPSGLALSGRSGSAIFGAAYGLLALDLPDALTINSPSLNSSASKANKRSAIVGGVIGGVVGLAIVGVIIAIWYRYRRVHKTTHDSSLPHPFNAVPTPVTQRPSRINSSSKANLGRLFGHTPSPPRTQLPAISIKMREISGSSEHRSMGSSGSTVPDDMNQNLTSVMNAAELRSEVAQLRRELESVRHMADLPPRYT